MGLRRRTLLRRAGAPAYVLAYPREPAYGPTTSLLTSLLISALTSLLTSPLTSCLPVHLLAYVLTGLCTNLVAVRAGEPRQAAGGGGAAAEAGLLRGRVGGWVRSSDQ